MSWERLRQFIYLRDRTHLESGRYGNSHCSLMSRSSWIREREEILLNNGWSFSMTWTLSMSDHYHQFWLDSCLLQTDLYTAVRIQFVLSFIMSLSMLHTALTMCGLSHFTVWRNNYGIALYSAESTISQECYHTCTHTNSDIYVQLTTIIHTHLSSIIILCNYMFRMFTSKVSYTPTHFKLKLKWIKFCKTRLSLSIPQILTH